MVSSRSGVTIDMQVLVLVDQEHSSMCLRHRKKKKLKVLAEIVLWESPPGADVLLTARHHSAASQTYLLVSASVLVWLLEFL